MILQNYSKLFFNLNSYINPLVIAFFDTLFNNNKEFDKIIMQCMFENRIY